MRSRPGSAPTPSRNGRSDRRRPVRVARLVPESTVEQRRSVAHADRERTGFVASPASASPYGAPEMRPRAAFQADEAAAGSGMRSEPPPSEPCATGTSPGSDGRAEPPDEPPGVRERSHGFRHAPPGPRIR